MGEPNFLELPVPQIITPLQVWASMGYLVWQYHTYSYTQQTKAEVCDFFKTGALPTTRSRSPSRSPAFVTATRLSAAAVTRLDLRRFLVDAGDDLVGDPQLHFP